MSSKNFFLLTAFGKDRPGIVAGVTKAIYDLGGNIEDASMTRLGGEFSMMLVAALPNAATAAQVEKKVAPIKKKLGLEINAKKIAPSAAHHPKQDPPKYLISIYGTDRTGIVHQVTQALAKRRISITDLQTKIVSGSPKPVYVMLVEIQVPPALDVDDLRTELDQLHQDLKLEVSLQDIEAVAL